MIPGLLLLMHLLVFVYWLGGDIGAFYAASLVTDTRLGAEARLTAARVLNAVDMAPASCLVLALPTGALLATAEGWWRLDWPVAVGIALGGLAWLAVVWRLHATRESSATLRRVDRTVRWSLLFLLCAAGLAALSGWLPMPLFIALKLLVLAATIGLGLAVRGVLGPYVTGLVALADGVVTPTIDQGLHVSLSRAKPMVVAIWGLLLTAAALGISHVG